VKYVDASAVLRILFREPGPSVPLADGDRVVSSHLVEIETFRAVDRVRLLGAVDDRQAAIKRKELTDLLAMIDLAVIDGDVISRAKSPFAINVRVLDAIHVATAEVLGLEAAGEALEFWTHDERQASAALSRGLAVRGAAQRQTAIAADKGPGTERKGPRL
jgi:predicted nucleic acid-binding protein